MKKFSKFLGLIIFGFLFVLALGLSGAKASDMTIDGTFTVNGSSWMNGGLAVRGDLYADHNWIKFNPSGYTSVDPTIDFMRGNSQIKEMGDLYAITDDYTHIGYTGGTGAVLIQNATEINSKSTTSGTGVLKAGATTVTSLSTDSFSLSGVQITASAAELNILDGATLTTSELNYVDGVSSAIQSQLNSKMNTTGGNITNDLHIGGTLQVDGTTTLSNATTITGLFRANGDGVRSIVSDSADLVLEAGYSTPKSLVLISDEDTTDAINIDATVGGIDIDAVGEAGQDINILNTGGSLVLSATESIADAIDIQATAGGIDIRASAASAGEDIDITATGSSINIIATEADAAAIVLNASAGGVDITAATNDLDLVASTLDINMTGATNIDLVATAGDVTMQTGDDLNVTLGDDSTWTMAAGSQITIDAATTDSTTDGVLRINMDTIGTTQTGALTIDLEVVDDADALDVVYGGYITVTHTSGDADGVWGWYIDQLNTATDVVPTTALLALDNSETTNADDDVSAGIRFLDGGVAGYTYAIDMNSATIDTAAVRLQNAATINNGAAGTATFDFNRDGDSTLTIQSTGSGATDETAVVIDSEGDTDATAIFTLTTDAVANDTNIFQILHGGIVVGRLDASSYWQIDATTTANTTTEGILDINSNMTENGAEVINLYARSSSDTDNEEISGIYINLDDDASAATSALYGLYVWANDVDSSGSVIGMYLDSTLADAGIISEDDTTIGFGTPSDIGSQATAYFLYETVDPDSNHLNLVLPEGGATDVPVFMIGDTSINNQNLGWFNGTTQTTLAIVSKDANNNDYLTLSVADSGVATIASGQDDIILDPAGNNINPGSDDADFLGAAGTEWSNIYTEALAVNMGDATDQIVIDASTTANTTTSGVIDLNIASTANNVGIDINSTVTDDNAIDTQIGLQITMTNNANDSDVVYGLFVADLGVGPSGGNEYAIYQSGGTWDYGLYISDDAWFDANTTIGSDIGDTLSINAGVLTNFTFAADGDKILSLGTPPPDTAGKNLIVSGGPANGATLAKNGGNLTLFGGAGSLAGNGGNAYLRGGALNGAGTDGGVIIGDSNTSSVAISTSSNNGNITLSPNGTGDVDINADTLQVGDNNANATITTDGTGDLILSTNSGTNSGTITIYDGAGGDISIAPNGAGYVNLVGDAKLGTGAADAYLTTNGAYNLVLSTNGGVNSGTITITDAANGNITLDPNGTGTSIINALAVSVTAKGAGAVELTVAEAGGLVVKSGGNDAVTLPDCGTATNGLVMMIKSTSLNTITLTANTGDTIDGAASNATMDADNDATILVCGNGAVANEWEIISAYRN